MCYCNSCCRCHKPILSNSVEIIGDELVVYLPEIHFYNGEVLNFVIAQRLPETKAIPVVIRFGKLEKSFNLLTRNGNNVYSDQVRPRQSYNFRYVSDTRKFINLGNRNLARTSYKYPRLLFKASNGTREEV